LKVISLSKLANFGLKQGTYNIIQFDEVEMI